MFEREAFVIGFASKLRYTHGAMDRDEGRATPGPYGAFLRQQNTQTLRFFRVCLEECANEEGWTHHPC